MGDSLEMLALECLLLVHKLVPQPRKDLLQVGGIGELRLVFTNPPHHIAHAHIVKRCLDK